MSLHITIINIYNNPKFPILSGLKWVPEAHIRTAVNMRYGPGNHVLCLLQTKNNVQICNVIISFWLKDVSYGYKQYLHKK